MEEDTQTIHDLKATALNFPSETLETEPEPFFEGQITDLEAELKHRKDLLDTLEDHLMQVDFGVAKPKSSEELVRMFRNPRKPPRATQGAPSASKVRRKSSLSPQG